MPPDAATGPLQLTYRFPEEVEPELIADRAPLPPPLANGRHGFGTFHLDATDSAGKPVHQFAAPLTMVARYTPEQLRVLGMHPGQLTFFWFDPARTETRPDGVVQQGVWVPIPSQVDAEHQTVTTTVDHDRTDNSCPATPSLAMSYGYDAGSNGIGQRTSMSVTGGASTSWTYDSRGRLDTATHSGPSFTGSRVFNWDYDSANRLTSLTYPANGAVSAETVTYSYDGAWRQTQICISGGGCYAQSGQYNALGQPTFRRYGNNAVQGWTYDSLVSRLSRLQVGTDSAAGTFFDRSYTYDAVGNITLIADNTTPGIPDQTYAYDHRDRLVSWTLGGTLQSYGYDPLGNLTTKAGVVQQYGANYDGTGAGPHQLRRLTGAGGPTFSYDANGNMTSGGGRSYVWNDESMPTSITAGGVPETYAYNADGARVSVTRSGTTTTYLEGLWEEESGGTVRKYYSLAGHVVVVRTSSGSGSSLSYLHNDHLGSVSLSTVGSGSPATPSLQSQQEFDPWGAVRSGSLPQTARNFTNQYLDGTGLLFYNARYYDPVIGRFVSADTIVPGSGALTTWPSDGLAALVWGGTATGPSNPQNTNRYTYVRNNPVRYTDPSGHTAAPPPDPAPPTTEPPPPPPNESTPDQPNTGETVVNVPAPNGGAVAVPPMPDMGADTGGANVTEDEPLPGSQEDRANAEDEKDEKDKKDKKKKPKEESRKSKKERATDAPEWAKGRKLKPGQSAEDLAKELMEEKYGPGAKYNTGPGSEYSKIKKHYTRK